MSGSPRARKYKNENDEINFFQNENALIEAEIIKHYGSVKAFSKAVIQKYGSVEAYNAAVTKPIASAASITMFAPSATNKNVAVYAGQEPYVLGVPSTFFRFKEEKPVTAVLNENGETASFTPNYTYGY